MDSFNICSHLKNAKEFHIYQFTYQQYPLLPRIRITMNTIQYPDFLFANTLECHSSLVTIINFIDCADLQSMYQAIQSTNIKLSQPTQSLILSFIFNKKYLTKVDRTMSYFIYQNPLTQNIDSLSAFNIALNEPQQPQNLDQTFNVLFNELQSKCMMNRQEVEAMKMIVTEPDLPLPVSLRSNIGEYCSSNFQLFVCSKIVQPFYSVSEESQFSEFKNFLSSNEEKYIKEILKNSALSNSFISKIKKLYENPDLFMETVSETEEVLDQENHIYNFFIVLMKLTKTLIKTIKLRLRSVESDPYSYFTEFLLRYSLFKNYVLQLQESLGQVVESFKCILEDSLNLNFGRGNQTEFSLWRILIRNFGKSMESQIDKCLPIYMNLAHKTKMNEHNQIYLRVNSLSQGNLIAGMQRFDGSPVLEYLVNNQNIDNAQVFLSDFMEMLVDFSVDESNILLCGSSRQQLKNKHFQKLEELIVEHEIQIIKRMIEEMQPNQIQSQSQQEFLFLVKELNIKPRTLRLLVNRLGLDSVRMDFESVDEALAQTNIKYTGRVYDMHSSKQSSGSTLTTDSEKSGNESDFEFEGLEYFSEVDEEQVRQIDF